MQANVHQTVRQRNVKKNDEILIIISKQSSKESDAEMEEDSGPDAELKRERKMSSPWLNYKVEQQLRGGARKMFE
ncbi:hypothetical protein HPP92_024645 [Vanilla planifolia]|uniref:Uncharacterized protein n=1 Tax=Vanilla planifolia TaxID=51239 RepID=A0A835PSM5_VANPL|nr:hypothetical protein HPP92_024645 [Vanilla planifolia]